MEFVELVICHPVQHFVDILGRSPRSGNIQFKTPVTEFRTISEYIGRNSVAFYKIFIFKIIHLRRQKLEKCLDTIKQPSILLRIYSYGIFQTTESI